MVDSFAIFVDVILPLALPKVYTYRVQKEFEGDVAVGKRVLIQFGAKRLYSAVIHKVHHTAPKQYQAKYIESILDEFPVVNEYQLALWEWISSYYMCTLGEVMVAALPSGLKLSSETKILIHPDYDGNDEVLNDKEFLVAEALRSQSVLSLQDIEQILDQKTIFPIIKGLIDKGVVIAEEEVKALYRPKKEVYVALSDEFDNETALKGLMDELSKAPKQLQLLMSFLHLSDYFNDGNQPIKKLVLQKQNNATSVQVNALVKKGIFELLEDEVSRVFSRDKVVLEEKQLSEYQLEKLNKVKHHFSEKEVVLLHGVTSSGKTELYIKLIEEQLALGKEALFLMPEIALTTQMISRLQKRFGNQVGVYHSKFNPNERVDLWKDLMTGNRFKVILGARSALFLPFKNLGLIIVDEEHESTFKQQDPAPRYHARDAAIVLAKMHEAKVLLGSATPSVESYTNAKNEKFGLVEMTKRFGNVQLPEVLVADVKEATRKKKMQSHFSPLLMEKMKGALENKEQIILFQNRRGFSPYLQCETCGWVMQCENCDVSLTYHKHFDEYRCHYCGYKRKKVTSCGACGSHSLLTKGFGTEKIEEELQLLFPEVKIARMDLDSTRSKHAYHKIITDFENQEVDILVGTQMVTKGLDFDNVSLVGVLNADNMLSFPDFRAFERSYQLMAQVSGRAGRKNKRGTVVIQSYNPEHTIIKDVIANDYENMYRNEVVDRRNYKYPPFYRIIQFTLRHKDSKKLNEASLYLSKLMRQKFGDRVLGPEYPLIARLKNMYNKVITLKLERGLPLKQAKNDILYMLEDMKSQKSYSSVRVVIDVDPL